MCGSNFYETNVMYKAMRFNNHFFFKRQKRSKDENCVAKIFGPYVNVYNEHCRTYFLGQICRKYYYGYFRTILVDNLIARLS